ncbi:MAG: hypothetical protein AB7O57_21655 [Hyphomicrobiaceae bacterium]
MENRVYIRVTHTTTGRSFVAPCFLPAGVGRGGDPANQVVLHDDSKTIGRFHGRLEDIDGALAWIDDSQNGSRLDGLPIRKAARPFDKSSILEIGPYRITLTDAKPLIVLTIDKSLQATGKSELLDGRGIGLALGTDVGLLNLDRQPPLVPGLAVWLERSGDVAVLVAADERAQARCTVNLAPLKGLRTQVQPLSVIACDGRRFELHQPQHPAIVCHNDVCQLLNEYSRVGQCRFCGHQLLGGTRVT